MDLLSQILDQVPRTSPPFIEFRKLLLQIDRSNSRKKSIAGLIRLSQQASTTMKPYVHCGLAMGYFLDHDYSKALAWLRELVSKHPMSPMALYGSTLMVSIYRMLGMKRERFEAEGSRLLILKRIAMQSEDPTHRILALSELKRELEERELHDEAQKCDLELNYWYSILKKKTSKTTTVAKTALRSHLN